MYFLNLNLLSSLQVMPIVLNIRVLPFLFEVSMVLHEVKRHRTMVDRLMCLVAVVEETCVACIVCETLV